MERNVKTLLKRILGQLKADQLNEFIWNLTNPGEDGLLPDISRGDLPQKSPTQDVVDKIVETHEDDAVIIVCRILRVMQQNKLATDLETLLGLKIAAPAPPQAAFPASAPPQVDVEHDVGSNAIAERTECYTLTHNPRGLCLIINNEHFAGNELKNRPGTREDEKALRSVFSRLGFEVKVHKDMTANETRKVLESLGKEDFRMADALVVCVLSHGDMGCVFGTDGQEVSLRELTQPFTGGHTPTLAGKTLAGKPKLFFIQACQGRAYQRGVLPCPSTPREGEGGKRSSWQEDASSVPRAADVLVGMATVEECKSFRNTSTGSIYIQELCRQLERAAASKEDILTVLTRVNREVSRGEYLRHKQMPEPKYTLTKKLILTFV